MKDKQPKLVSVRMRDNTISQVETLAKKVHAPSKSDAIRSAVEISSLLLDAVEQGGKVILEDKNGKQKQVLIQGLKN